MKAAFCEGFAPVFDENSRVLILGSFPSVKSRAQGFYYGNPQNKFWRTLGAFFHEEPPKDVEGRRAYVLKHGAALWDVVISCTIEGSSDASIQGETVADVASLVKGSNIRRILCNGTTAYNLFQRHFPELVPIAKKLPSTSPAQASSPTTPENASESASGHASGQKRGFAGDVEGSSFSMV